jgi:hypothetical protein
MEEIVQKQPLGNFVMAEFIDLGSWFNAEICIFGPKIVTRSMEYVTMVTIQFTYMSYY